MSYQRRSATHRPEKYEAHNNPSNGATNYMVIVGKEGSAQDTEGAQQIIMTKAGTFRRLNITLTNPPNGATKTWTFLLRINSGNGTLTCVITNAETTGSDLTNSDHVNIGDKVCLRSVPANAPDPMRAFTSMEFQPD